MVCSITFTERRRAAFTLVEVLVGSAIGLVVHLSRLADGSRKVTQIMEVLGSDRDGIVVQDLFLFEDEGFDADGRVLGQLRPTGRQPRYIPQTKALTRTKGGVTQTNLTDCDFLEFSIFQRTPSNDTFQPYSITNVAETKLIELTWRCSRKILGTTANSESMQSAKIVIRKR